MRLAERAAVYIAAHPCRRVTLAELSAALGYSAEYIRHAMGGVGRTVRMVRLQQSRRLLSESGRSVSSVARTLGLTPSQFSAFFKKATGVTPTEYRRNNV